MSDYKKNINKSTYQRPKITYTDKLTTEEIEELLEDYVEVDDMYKIKLGTHLRYITTKDGKKKFRTGGNLFLNKGLPDYVVLNNKDFSWTVQMKNTKFFRKMSPKEIKKDYEEEIDEINEEKKELELQVKKYRNLLEQYKKEIIELKNRLSEYE